MTIDELKELERKATPGPWETCFETEGCFAEETVMKAMSLDGADAQVIGTGWYDGYHTVLREDDGGLIAALRNLAPELLALWEASEHWLFGKDTSTGEIASAVMALRKRASGMDA